MMTSYIKAQSVFSLLLLIAVPTFESFGLEERVYLMDFEKSYRTDVVNQYPFNPYGIGLIHVLIEEDGQFTAVISPIRMSAKPNECGIFTDSRFAGETDFSLTVSGVVGTLFLRVIAVGRRQCGIDSSLASFEGFVIEAEIVEDALKVTDVFTDIQNIRDTRVELSSGLSISTSNFPNVMEVRHGNWEVSPDENSDGFWALDQGIDSWLWIYPEYYPYMYSTRYNSWVYYIQEDWQIHFGEGRLFYIVSLDTYERFPVR